MDSVPASDRFARRPPRARCAVCGLPSSTCLCALAACVDNRVDVLVLQHPLEAREAKGSARLLRLSLARCRLEVGETFDEATLRGLLQADDRRSVLLYPQDGEVEAGEPASLPAGPRDALRLVVLDGTWRKSLRMLRSNPLLQALPRLALQPVSAGRYALLRKARHAVQMSTLEATCAALAQLEGDEERYAPLLQSFGRFVDDRVARRSKPSP